MKNYNVEYELNGMIHTNSVKASNPGQAFAKTLALFPGSTLKKCIWQTRLAGNIRFPMVHINYDAPSVRKVEPLATDPGREQASFGFMDKIKPRARR